MNSSNRLSYLDYSNNKVNFGSLSLSSHTLLIALLFFYIIETSTAVAETAKDKDFSNLLMLDLKSLQSINFTSVSSKVEEPISDTVGSVSLFSSTEINQYSYFTLGDLADITPGYSSHIRFGERIFETRGQRAASFNNDRHLLLVDGIPIHHARNYKVPTDNELPLFFADKVEFLRGPASALYGTSAFFGVINVTPQEATKEGLSFDSRISAGAPESQVRANLNAFYNSSLGKTTMSLGYYKKDASEDYVGIFNDKDWLNYDDQDSRFVYFKHRFADDLIKGLSVGLLYSRKSGGLGEYWLGDRSYSSNDLTWESVIPYLKFETEIIDSVNFSGYLKHNRSREIGDVVIDPDGPILKQKYESVVEDYEAQAEVFYSFSEKTNFILGINFDARRELGYPESSSVFTTLTGNQRDPQLFNGDSEWITILAGFLQARHEFDFLKGTLITAGARYTVGEFDNQENTNFSPRVTIIQRIRDDFNIKLQYSTAFRIPGLKEFGFNKEKNANISNLEPEEFETAEISLVYFRPNFLLELNFFHNVTSDVIDFEAESQFINRSGKTTSVGGEISLKYAFDMGLDLNMNYSYALSEDARDKRLDDIPTHKANLILNYSDTFNNLPYNVALINRWIKDYSVSGNQNRPDGYFISDINFGVKLYTEIEIGLQIRNLWDKKYKIPNNGIEEIPMPERTMQGYIRYNY